MKQIQTARVYLIVCLSGCLAGNPNFLYTVQILITVMSGKFNNFDAVVGVTWMFVCLFEGYLFSRFAKTSVAVHTGDYGRADTFKPKEKKTDTQ